MKFHFCDLNHSYKNQEGKIRSRKTAPGNIRKKQKGDNVSKTKSGRHRLSKTDKRLLAALVVAGYEERTARDLIQKHVYTLTQADLRHLVSEISNGVGQSQAYDAIYQARRIRLARKYLSGKKPEGVEPREGRNGKIYHNSRYQYHRLNARCRI